jgi:hypothetical protein
MGRDGQLQECDLPLELFHSLAGARHFAGSA